MSCSLAFLYSVSAISWQNQLNSMCLSDTSRVLWKHLVSFHVFGFEGLKSFFVTMTISDGEKKPERTSEKQAADMFRGFAQEPSWEVEKDNFSEVTRVKNPGVVY